MMPVWWDCDANVFRILVVGLEWNDMKLRMTWKKWRSNQQKTTTWRSRMRTSVMLLQVRIIIIIKYHHQHDDDDAKAHTPDFWRYLQPTQNILSLLLHLILWVSSWIFSVLEGCNLQSNTSLSVENLVRICNYRGSRSSKMFYGKFT